MEKFQNGGFEHKSSQCASTSTSQNANMSSLQDANNGRNQCSHQRPKRKIFTIVYVALSSIAIVILTVLLVFTNLDNSYGLTMEAAAGPAFKDAKGICIGDRHIYMNTMVVNDDRTNGETIEYLTSFVCLEDAFIGYRAVPKEEYDTYSLYFEGEYVGVLYSLKQAHSCDNFFIRAKKVMPEQLVSFNTIMVNGERCGVDYNSYFNSHETPQSIAVGETELRVERNNK